MTDPNTNTEIIDDIARQLGIVEWWNEPAVGVGGYRHCVRFYCDTCGMSWVTRLGAGEREYVMRELWRSSGEHRCDLSLGPAGKPTEGEG